MRSGRPGPGRLGRGLGALACAALILAPGACAPRVPAGARYAELAPYQGREIEEVRFLGAAPFPADSLARRIETRPTRCSLLGLPICVPVLGLGEEEHFLDLGTLARDVQRLERFFRQRGFFGTAVQPVVEEEADGDVAVTFVVSRGAEILLDTLVVRGTEGILDPDSLARRLPLRPGERFDLAEFARSAELVRAALLDRGHAFAQVLRDFTVDAAAGRAAAELRAVPGPQVRIDTILVRGAVHLGGRTARRQLAVREGQLFDADRLAESQLNLYSLDLVQFASVSLAPDSLQRTPRDSTTATVLVQIVEAPLRAAEAAVGFGTVDCLRAELGWVHRNFVGGARRLALSGAVAKVGIARPVRAGAGRSICRAFRGDPFADVLDYRFAADLTQPWFLNPRNHLTVSAFAERQSEPNVFQREARGGRLVLAHRLAPRTLLTGTLAFERGRTAAVPALFCATFEICDPGDIAALARGRWRNTVGANWVRDRTDRAYDPTRGTLARLGAAWAAAWLGSDPRFVRGTGEGYLYRPAGGGRVVALGLRVGTFVAGASLRPGRRFIPPEERFYAGGPTTVRGFERNGLGPGLYVTDSIAVDPTTGDTVPGDGAEFVPSGGTSMAVANAELRAPAPFGPPGLRIVAFVDAGAVDTARVWELSPADWRVTPGLGIRAETPVGPVRLDIAYDAYAPRRAPLFLARGDTLVRVRDDFAPPRPSLLRRFRLHLALGQAF